MPPVPANVLFASNGSGLLAVELAADGAMNWPPTP